MDETKDGQREAKEEEEPDSRQKNRRRAPLTARGAPPGEAPKPHVPFNERTFVVPRRKLKQQQQEDQKPPPDPEALIATKKPGPVANPDGSWTFIDPEGGGRKSQVRTLTISEAEMAQAAQRLHHHPDQGLHMYATSGLISSDGTVLPRVVRVEPSDAGHALQSDDTMVQ